MPETFRDRLSYIRDATREVFDMIDGDPSPDVRNDARGKLVAIRVEAEAALGMVESEPVEV